MEYLLILFLFIFGGLVGMFVNYMADVLPWRRKFVKPFCLNCQANFSWLNYFIIPRKCSSCGQIRLPRTWLVEILYGLITVGLLYYHPVRLGFLGGLFVIGYFGVVVIIDIEHRLILHPVSIFGAVSGLVIAIR